MYNKPRGSLVLHVRGIDCRNGRSAETPRGPQFFFSRQKKNAGPRAWSPHLWRSGNPEGAGSGSMWIPPKLAVLEPTAKTAPAGLEKSFFLVLHFFLKETSVRLGYSRASTRKGHKRPRASAQKRRRDEVACLLTCLHTCVDRCLSIFNFFLGRARWAVPRTSG